MFVRVYQRVTVQQDGFGADVNDALHAGLADGVKGGGRPSTLTAT